jgi:hypothetical protein
VRARLQAEGEAVPASWKINEVAFVGADVLGERAFAPAEQVVAGLKPFHVPADRLDLPGDVGAPDRLLRDAESVPGRADDGRTGPHDVPLLRIDRGRVYAHEHVAVADRGTLDLFQLQDLWRAIPVLDYCPDRAPVQSWGRPRQVDQRATDMIVNARL